MSLKDQLLEESKNIETQIELDSVFESVDLNDDVKLKFSAVFESAVKSRALSLAESHIAAIAERSEELVSARVEEEVSEINETVNTYFDHLVEEWKETNQVQIENGIKVELFESMMAMLKATFVEHNIEIPAESVNVVAELETELSESAAELNKAVKANHELRTKLNAMEMREAVEAAVKNLTESQKEKVATLVEGLKFDEKFQAKLDAIVEMVESKTVTPAEAAKSPEDVAKAAEAQAKAATKQVASNVTDKSGTTSLKEDTNLDGLNGDKPEETPLVEKKVPDHVKKYLGAI